MNIQSKIAILADAAKYDASCASSGSVERNSRGGKGVGSTSAGMGICHSYAPDGRCISLLKILLTNFCLYDCAYCINRVSSPVARARFTPDEVVQLTLDFYKRNYIEGLFLSSGIIQSSDYTMEQLVEVARSLREDYDFRGYIHLKTIPEAAPELLALAGRYADRLSINIELPEDQSLVLLAPEKSGAAIRQSMGVLKSRIDEYRENKRDQLKARSLPSVGSQVSKLNHLSANPTQSSGIALGSRAPALKSGSRKGRAKVPLYAPAGQSTQMIIGADASNDQKILTTANGLYRSYQMRRVYYSAYSPIQYSAATLPATAPPLMREHRLYQADWLLRFYGFSVQEIVGAQTRPDGMLDIEIDPKLAWALANRDMFPVNINKASKSLLLRIPGIGSVGANRIINARRFKALRFNDLAKCRVAVKKVAPFIETLDYNPNLTQLDSQNLREHLLANNSMPAPQQLGLF
ncbi:MAG TPA: putative DNA modification/repair radical SAM protein [Marinagarivorans sp.]